MIRVGLRFLSWILDDKKSEGFSYIRIILKSNRLYPTHNQLNTRRFVHNCLMRYIEIGRFSDIQISILKRVSNG